MRFKKRYGVLGDLQGFSRWKVHGKTGTGGTHDIHHEGRDEAIASGGVILETKKQPETVLLKHSYSPILLFSYSPILLHVLLPVLYSCTDY